MPTVEIPAPSPSWRGVPVLVTGGAGFLGSHVVERLACAGARVRVLDDLSTGREDNLEAARRMAPVELLRGDVTDRAALRDALSEGTRCVFHLAAVVGVPLALRDPLRAMRVNVRGTEEVCDAARAAGVQRVVLTSSSEVYGDRDDVPFRESDPVQPGSTDDPRGAYAASKALAEWCMNAHAAAGGLETVVARLFNTVGPRQRARQGMVLPRFVEQALRGLPLTVYGDGRQRRCFADVRDVTAWLVELGALHAAAGRTVNVGSDRELSIADLAAEVVRACGSASGTRHLPFEAGVGAASRDVRRRVPDLTRLRDLGLAGAMRPFAETLQAVCAERSAARQPAAPAAEPVLPAVDA